MDHLGFNNDRRYVLISNTNRFISAREFPKMTTIITSLNKDGNLVVNAPNMPTLTIPTVDESHESNFFFPIVIINIIIIIIVIIIHSFIHSNK